MSYSEIKERLKGVTTALATPYVDSEIDLNTYEEFVRWQIDEGISGLSPCGTTGEAPTLNNAEKLRMISTCVKVAARKVPVIAGTGTNDTLTTIALTSAAAACGADVALIVTPYYNRPSQEGIYRHYEAVAKSTNLPIIIYNVPARTGVDLSLETLERLAELPSIVGIKDATGELTRSYLLSRQVGDRFIQLSGHDRTSVEFNLAYGQGSISVVSNVLPKLWVEIHRDCAVRNSCDARTKLFSTTPLLTALEIDTNPVPIKYALHHKRGFPMEVRLPLVQCDEETKSAIRRAFVAFDSCCENYFVDNASVALEN